jgi:carboxyl-terminal processing protease
MNKILITLMVLLPLLGKAQLSIQAKTITLQRLLAKKHYKPVVWNDSAAAMLYKKWVNSLDDEKLFFTQKEFDVLDKLKNNIDDEIMGKGWNFLPQTILMYKQRLQKVDSFIKILTQKPFDFLKPDNLNWPLTNFATTDAELMQRWQKYLKWETLNYIAKEVADSNGLTTKPPTNFVQLESKAREKVKSREVNYIQNLLSTPANFTTILEERYLNCIAWCYDPHTNYFTTKRKNEFEAATSASEFSCGLELDENDKGDIVIEYLQPGSSAWRSGQLHKGDILESVWIKGVEKNVKDIDNEDLNNALNGASSGAIEITVKSAAGEIKKVKLQKEKIEDDEAIVKSYVLHGKQNIGYINLPGFYSREDDAIENEKDIKFDGCANDVSKEIIKLKKDTIAGLILDLRDNGGGSMWEAMQLAGIFIDIGPVALVKDKEGKQTSLKDPNRGTIYDGPMLVLINGASASASEFLSAALQDYKRAIVVGGTTYGKGSAQYVQPLDTNAVDKNKTYDDFIKITASKFYRVSGGTTQWTGVVPDIALPDVYTNMEHKEKNSESALQPDNAKPALYRSLPDLPIKNLAAKSAERIKLNTAFIQLNNFINWQKLQNTNKNVPLQWAGFSKEYNDVTKMYKQWQNNVDKSKTNTINVTNNGFDWQRLLQSTSRSKEINKVHLDDIKDDEIIGEAYNILMDWNNK